jgi:hypothetical protein
MYREVKGIIENIFEGMILLRCLVDATRKLVRKVLASPMTRAELGSAGTTGVVLAKTE